MSISTPSHFSRVDQDARFVLESPNKPTGDQPQAIAQLLKYLNDERERVVLLGVTGSGKTFTMANVIAELNRPALVLAHNKTLAAQLYSEFRELFPQNAVRFFVSYYDYYQPEAYVPSTDTYIEKDASINDEIDKLRHAATKALLERRDAIVVASVSCIYGLGAPENYYKMMVYLETGDELERGELLRRLVELQYTRNDIEFSTGTFRVRGDVVEICPASESERSIRVEFFGDEIEDLSEIDRLSGKVLRRLEKACVYPASHYVTDRSDIERAIATIRLELAERLQELGRQGKVVEAHRLEQRTLYDLELLDEMGFCPGIENYSRHLTGRAPGEPPPTLIDYFPKDFLCFIDESHATVPQLVGMYRGDRSRKQTLVDYGFRLPSAVDNRPLRFDEFEQRVGQVVYVSATPGEFERADSNGAIVEQIIRPTGLLDPQVVVRSASSQVDDYLAEVRRVADLGERALVTTLTKRMAEDLTEYYREVGVRVKYLHSDIHTLDRIDLIRGLRQGDFDLLVGINLLREGLDLPEVSLVGIMDADKEGFLRSETSLVQTIGRAARNVNGLVVLYADRETDSIRAALRETDRRRERQEAYNKEHGITPRTVSRAPEAVMVEPDELEAVGEVVAELHPQAKELPRTPEACRRLIEELRKQMFDFAKAYEFEQAALVRDRIALLERFLLTL
ncbi:MAG: excinuclease ABC subunit UvrB [Bdellovibrionales bacterium]|nr:excinuclease ABC subunit UvrB [Bdellovibrionales bacterium]